MAENRILEGVRVLTLEQVHALPWGTSFLADLGAQVIRVESVVHLQDRKSGPFPGGRPSEEWWNEAGNLAYFGARNKQSLCLEVADPRGKEVFLKLAQECDIVTDNFRPGTMARYGFDHESLSKLNPRIITLSSTAFGYTGSWSRAGSRARTVDASCGMSYLTGYEDGPSRRASNNYMDHSVGNNVAYALLLALYQRNKTGQGMRIDLNGKGIRVGAINPGLVATEFSEVRFKGDSDRASKVYQGYTPLQPEDIADIILFAVTRPPHVNIADLTVMCLDQATSTIVNKR